MRWIPLIFKCELALLVVLLVESLKETKRKKKVTNFQKIGVSQLSLEKLNIL